MGTIAVPAFFRGKGCDVLTKADQFGKRTVPDVEWLQWCGAEWVAITKDEAAVRKVREEMAAARRFKVRVFYFPKADLSRAQMLGHLERHWVNILERSAHVGPFAVAIYSDRLEDRA